MIDILFKGLSELTQKLRALPDALNDALAAKLQALADVLKTRVQDDELSGQALESRTGTLKASIESDTQNDGDVISASVFVSGDVPYAAILEYGGITKAHIIEATQGKALAFSFQGKQSFFRAVNHPGSDIGAHPYLEPALQGMQDDIFSELQDVLKEVV